MFYLKVMPSVLNGTMPKKEKKKRADNFPVWDFGWFPVTIKNIAVDI